MARSAMSLFLLVSSIASSMDGGSASGRGWGGAMAESAGRGGGVRGGGGEAVAASTRRMRPRIGARPKLPSQKQKQQQQGEREQRQGGSEAAASPSSQPTAGTTAGRPRRGAAPPASRHEQIMDQISTQAPTSGVPPLALLSAQGGVAEDDGGDLDPYPVKSDEIADVTMARLSPDPNAYSAGN